MLINMFKFIWQEQSKHNKMFFAMLILLIISAALADVLAPYLFSKMVDTFPTIKPGLTFGSLCKIFGIIFVVWSLCRLLSTLCWKFMRRMMAFVKNKTIEQLENRIRRIMFEKSMSFYNKRFAGAITNKENKFISSYGSLFDEFVFNVWPNSLRFIGSAVLLLFVSWQFALVFLVYGVMYFTFMIRYSVYKVPYDEYSSKKGSRMNGRVTDLHSNIQTIKLFAAEQFEQDRFEKQNHWKFLTKMLSWKLANIRDNIISFCNDVIMIIVMFMSIWLWNQQSITTGIVVLVMLYSGQIRLYLHTLGNSIKNSLFYYADMVELMEYVQKKPEIVDAGDCVENVGGDCSIEFKNVTFRHQNAKKALFKNFSLIIKPGEKVGLVGHSGGGKTTLVSILPRLYEIADGDILIGGTSIKRISQKTLRRKISVISQEPMLFHRTIYDIIRYDTDATMEDVVYAAQQACADEFINELPLGYRTVVGERGVMLSGGQKQRIAIARAFLKKSEIMILDEATSAMDAQNERQIQKALQNLESSYNCTMLIIAHRLPTVMHLDRVVVIEGGRVIEDGTPQELLEAKDAFYHLWRAQQNPETLKYQLQLLTEQEKLELFAEAFPQQKILHEKGLTV